MKNIIFFDIDGTIVEEGGSYYIPESTFTAFNLLKKNGNLLYINSGRTKSEIEDRILTSFPFTGLICGCGTYIEENGHVLFSRNINKELTKEIVKELEKCQIEWLLEGAEKIYYSETYNKTPLKVFREQHLELVPDNTIIASPAELIKNGAYMDKLCIFNTDVSDFNTFKKKFDEYFEFIDRGEGFFEIIPIGSSKAFGMDFLMDYYNIDKEHTYAIGDSLNDMSMLSNAGTSICMGNGHEELKKTASLVTDNLRDDGLFNAFRKLKLI